MALVVEDGTGTNPLANSYVSLAEFSAYWLDRGFDYTEYTTPAIQQALIKATDYIEQNNMGMWKGYLLEEDQPLQWPRTYVYVNCQEADPVPRQLKYATFEYAKRVLTSDDAELQPDPEDRDESGQLIEKRFEKIGPIETDTTYFAGSGSSVKSYPTADKWLYPLLRYGSGNGSIRN
jgi:hypothetical protein